MASRYDIHSNRGYDTNRAIREYRATRKREKDPNRPLTLLEQLGIEQDSDTDRLDALERIESQYGDPAYPLRGQVTRKTQEQAEYMRNFLRGATESAVAGETSMADKVIGLTEAGNFNFDAAKNLENPQNSLEVINTTDYGLSPDMAEGSDDKTIEGSGPVDTSALREAAGYRLAAEGLDATDFGLSPDRDSIGPIPVTTERLPRLSVPGAPTVDQMTGRSLLRRALEASRNPIDMQRFEQLAQDRKRDGGLSMITSLAAGEAGPRYSDYKENYLKKAMAEKGEKQLGDYGFASGGQFYETPGIQQAREAETDIAGAELLFDSESDRLARDQAERRLELAERAYDPNYSTKGERNRNAAFLVDLKTKSTEAERALSRVGTMREALGTANQGIYAPISNALNAAIAEFPGADGPRRKTIAANTANAIASAFGIDKLSQIGGNDTERELAVAISTAFQMTNQDEANTYLLNKLEESMTKTVLRSQFSDLWSEDFKTVNNINPVTRETYGMALEKFLAEETPKRLGREIEGVSIFGDEVSSQDDEEVNSGVVDRLIGMYGDK